MPLKLNIGLSRKVGLPDYGSLGASCQIELELESAMLSHDPVSLGDRARQAYAACAEAVDDALMRHRPTDKGSRHPGRTAGAKNGQSTACLVRPLPATAKQMEYVRRLASQVPGLDESRLETFVQQRCNKLTAALSRNEASQLIDEMRQLVAETSPHLERTQEAEWQEADTQQINNGYEPENGYHTANGSPDAE